jgi:hypothetical protein
MTVLLPLAFLLDSHYFQTQTPHRLLFQALTQKLFHLAYHRHLLRHLLFARTVKQAPLLLTLRELA